MLAIRFSALGDVAMTVAPLADAAYASPECEITLLTRPLPAKAMRGVPPNLKVRAVDTSRYKGVGGLWRLAAELWRELRPDTVVDLHDVLRSRLISVFMRMRGARVVRFDKGRAAKRALTRSRRKARVQLPSGDSRYREALGRAGLPAPSRFLDEARRIWRGNRRDAAPAVVAVAPFAAHGGKEWPVERTEAVVAHFAARPETRVLLFGAGDRESAILGRWERMWPDTVTDMSALHLGLAAEIDEMSRCDVMLSMDSANMHLASLAGVPVVSVWGATDPRAGFLGLGQDPADALGAEMECRPCSVFGNCPCRLTGACGREGSRPCLDAVSVAQVTEAVERHLQPCHARPDT